MVSDLVLLFICCFFVTIGNYQLLKQTAYKNIPDNILWSAEFRAQKLDEDTCRQLQSKTNVGEYIGNYLLEKNWGNKLWIKNNHWKNYQKYMKAIWDDVDFFPIPAFSNQSQMKVSYVDTWMAERTYGGVRGHEGTDIMAQKNERGLYPIVSMTDGTVTNKGWLEKGGYRIGITAPGGAYFYYAHLDSYSHINIGDQVKAGDLLGFMGDSGYGIEGTVGQFAVHLHLGIYLYLDGKEVSVNPYWILRYIENKRVKCYTNL